MKRFFAPEVVQTSALDCGPATLKCLLAGFGIRVSYGRLREACQTALDGTSIDTMEVVANQLGLEAEQITVPVDHVFIPEARTLPAIAIVQLPTGLTHFVVVWKRLGNYVQIMDPATGRRWIRWRVLMQELYRHRMTVPAEGWREWAGSDDFLLVLKSRLGALRIPNASIEQLCSAAIADLSWQGLAALDAATRFTQTLAQSGAIRRTSDRARVLSQFRETPDLIPEAYWTVIPATPDEEGIEQVLVSGAILVRALGVKPAETDIGAEDQAASLRHAEAHPLRFAFEQIRKAGLTALFTLLFGILFAAGLSVFEAVLFRSLFDMFDRLRLAGQQFGAICVLALFSLAVLGLEWANFTGTLRFGRQLEAYLRLAFLRKLPKLSDRYFHSRLISDMAERSHVTYRLKQMPDYVAQCFTLTTRLLSTAAGLVWLMPHSWPMILGIVAATVIPPVLAVPLLGERDLKTRTHSGALMRFYLDAMLGMMPIRAHSAARNVKAEQEKLLGEWAGSALALQRTVLSTEAVQTILVFLLIAGLLLPQSFHSTGAGRILLIVYWVLNVPLMGRDLGRILSRYPGYRNLLARLVEPIEAPEETVGESVQPLSAAPAIAFRNVSVAISGTSILNQLDLSIEPASHIAVIGPSGAGKSSLVSLLLGWLAPSSGSVLIDGKPLDVEQIRRSVAWVDPAIQIWNSSLLSNISYGSEAGATGVSAALEEAMLRSVLENLPSGLQTKLGEGGGLVSGGEGQRVRFARAALRQNAPLVILDEPFRGLDRDKRRELLARARQLWRNATLICITHDIHQSRQFDQVAVIENGGISAYGKPLDLLSDPASRYSQLLEAERNTHSGLWSARFWRRIRVEGGRAIETVGDAPSSVEVEAEVA